MRIKEIKSYDDNGVLLESKYYKYGSNEDGNGRATRQVNHADYLSPFLVVESINVGTGHEPTPGYKILYKTYGAFPKCSYFTQGSTVVYPYVTEYIGSATGQIGKTVYNYTDFQDYYYDRTMRGYVTELPKWSYAWKCGKLLRKTVYDANGQTVYNLQNTFQEINNEEFLNLRVNLFAQFTNSSVEKDFSNYPKLSTAIDGSLHDYFNYYISRGDYVVKESREMIDAVTKITQYAYNTRGQLTEETYIDPDNNRYTTCYRYPNEFWNTAPYNTMIQKNIVGPVIEREELKNGTNLYRTKNNYMDFGNNLITLSSINQFNTQRLRYSNHDYYGNPQTVEKDNLESTAYLWSYKGRYLIAEIKNTNYNHISASLFNAFLTELNRTTEPTAEQMAKVESLRLNSSFSRCQVTTFYYNSYGLSKVIAPNGTITTYEYDLIGRLSRIKDHNGKIIEEYQYNYK